MGANYVNISHTELFTEKAPFVLDENVQTNLDTLLSWIEKAGMVAVISFRTGPGRSEFTFVLEDVGDWFDASYLNDSVWQDQTAQQGWIDMWQFTRKLSLEVYGIGRIGRDVNRDFWNNRAEKGIGMRIRFSHKVFLALYSDWIQGQYLKVSEDYPQADNDRYHDFRTGLIFWYGKSKWFTSDAFISFHFKPALEIYSDISYYQKQRHNIIGYANIKYGVEFLRIWKMSLMGYGVLYLAKDTKKDFWNNKADIGPGFWIKPLRNLELKFIFEWLYGSYFGIEGINKNPYPKHFKDRRIGVTFWHGW